MGAPPRNCLLRHNSAFQRGSEGNGDRRGSWSREWSEGKGGEWREGDDIMEEGEGEGFARRRSMKEWTRERGREREKKRIEASPPSLLSPSLSPSPTAFLLFSLLIRVSWTHSRIFNSYFWTRRERKRRIDE